MTDLSKDLPRVTDLPRTSEKKSTRTSIVDITPKDDVPAMDAVVGGMNFSIGHSFSNVLNCGGGTTTHGTKKATVTSLNGCHDTDSDPDF